MYLTSYLNTVSIMILCLRTIHATDVFKCISFIHKTVEFEVFIIFSLCVFNYLMN